MPYAQRTLPPAVNFLLWENSLTFRCSGGPYWDILSWRNIQVFEHTERNGILPGNPYRYEPNCKIQAEKLKRFVIPADTWKYLDPSGIKLALYHDTKCGRFIAKHATVVD